MSASVEVRKPGAATAAAQASADLGEVTRAANSQVGVGESAGRQYSASTSSASGATSTSASHSEAERIIANARTVLAASAAVSASDARPSSKSDSALPKVTVVEGAARKPHAEAAADGLPKVLLLAKKNISIFGRIGNAASAVRLDDKQKAVHVKIELFVQTKDRPKEADAALDVLSKMLLQDHQGADMAALFDSHWELLEIALGSSEAVRILLLKLYKNAVNEPTKGCFFEVLVRMLVGKEILEKAAKELLPVRLRENKKIVPKACFEYVKDFLLRAKNHIHSDDVQGVIAGNDPIKRSQNFVETVVSTSTKLVQDMQFKLARQTSGGELLLTTSTQEKESPFEHFRVINQSFPKVHFLVAGRLAQLAFVDMLTQFVLKKTVTFAQHIDFIAAYVHEVDKYLQGVNEEKDKAKQTEMKQAFGVDVFKKLELAYITYITGTTPELDELDKQISELQKAEINLTELNLPLLRQHHVVVKSFLNKIQALKFAYILEQSGVVDGRELVALHEIVTNPDTIDCQGLEIDLIDRLQAKGKMLGACAVTTVLLYGFKGIEEYIGKEKADKFLAERVYRVALAFEQKWFPTAVVEKAPLKVFTQFCGEQNFGMLLTQKESDIRSMMNLSEPVKGWIMAQIEAYKKSLVAKS